MPVHAAWLTPDACIMSGLQKILPSALLRLCRSTNSQLWGRMIITVTVTLTWFRIILKLPEQAKRAITSASDAQFHCPAAACRCGWTRPPLVAVPAGAVLSSCAGSMARTTNPWKTNPRRPYSRHSTRCEQYTERLLAAAVVAASFGTTE